jgi:hypothetical protein
MRSVIVLLDIFANALMLRRCPLHHAMAPAGAISRMRLHCIDGRFALRLIVTQLSRTRCTEENASRRAFFGDPRGNIRTPCG